jgi:Fe-S-cluster containining protein
MNTPQPFYAEGLLFSCRRCSACCRYEPGFVYLSKKDIAALTKALQSPYDEFVQIWCRWTPIGGGQEILSLKETAQNDCIFWKDGCSVYTARPTQCRTFPFWPSLLASHDAWKQAAATCPGIGQGQLHERKNIEARLAIPDEPITRQRAHG